MIAYVSRSCGACSKFLMMLASNPKLLAMCDVRIIDDSDAHKLAMADMGARLTPTLVIRNQHGVMKYEGPAASQALIAMA